MARDYKNLNRKKTAKSLVERFSNTLSFLTGLALGLFVAVIVYFNEHNAAIETSNILLNDRKNSAAKDEEVPLPEPTFDFYKILPDKEINISEWETAKEEITREETAQTEEESVMFVIQIGSFQQYSEADRMKAKLALMGVATKIQRVVINGRDVRYRVRTGPYKNDDKLRQTQQRLLTSNLDFMLLKLKIEDT